MLRSLIRLSLSHCLILVLCFLPLTVAANSCNLEGIQNFRLQGDLAHAQLKLRMAMTEKDLAVQCRIKQHIEMATILDRIGLHHYGRPVAEALQQIDLAANLLELAEEKSEALVELAYADYYYRAEMQARQFQLAESHAHRAIRLFRKIGDDHGEADAIHRFGLIEFQRGNLGAAAALFDESLELDVAGGQRTFFAGEYERHIGFVAYRNGDAERAAGHFVRSLQARIDAGAIDASMFAAISLASVLIELDRRDEAQEHIEYADRVARAIDSPAGLDRIERLHEN